MVFQGTDLPDGTLKGCDPKAKGTLVMVNNEEAHILL